MNSTYSVDPAACLHASPLDRIAIVTVTFNACRALQETVRAVADLNDPRVSLYIVDGASKDETVGYLQTLKESWIHWTSEPDRGIFDAMNKGWRAVPDDHLILYMGAGDRPLALPRSQDILEAAEQDVHVLIGHCTHGTQSVDSEWCDTLYYGCTINHQAVLVRKCLHPNPPFDATFKAYADWDFDVRLYAAGVKARHVANFRSYADPNGVSSRVHVGEAARISLRHGGLPSFVKAMQRHVPIRVDQLHRQFRIWLSSGSGSACHHGAADEIAFVSHEASRSGAPILLLNFLRWLVERREVKVDVLFLKDGPLRQDFDKVGRTFVSDAVNGRHGTRARLLHRRRRNDEAFWRDRTCRRLVAASQYDAVYGNTVATLPWVSALADVSDVPTICHFHEMAWAIGQFFSPDYVTETLGRLDAVIACSPAVASDLQQFFSVPPPKITVVDSFVEATHPVAESAIEVRRLLGLPADAIVIGSIGRAETRKGVDLMVLLLQRLVERKPSLNFRAIWVGTSPFDPALSTCQHDLRKLGLTDRFTFLEHTSRPNEYLNAFDVYALTSREEPMGMAALDAACLCRPIVAFDKASGIAPLIEAHLGTVVPYLAVDAMADAIFRVLAEPDEFRHRSAKLRDHVLARYTLEAVAPALVEVVDRVASKRAQA